MPHTAHFKSKRATWESKHKCTLDLSYRGNEHIVWTIGITFHKGKSAVKSLHDVKEALRQDLYQAAFGNKKDALSEHESIYLAYDIAMANPHWYQPVPTTTTTTTTTRDGDNNNLPPIVWQHEGSAQHAKGYMAILETGAIKDKAVSILVGPHGFGVRAIRGDCNVFVCVLERPRIGLFLVSTDSPRAVQHCLVRAKQRLAWAKAKIPRFFGKGDDNDDIPTNPFLDDKETTNSTA